MDGLRKAGRKAAITRRRWGMVLRGGKLAEPAGGFGREEERRMRQRLGAAGQDKIGEAIGDLLEAEVDRLQPRGAVALHRPAGNLDAERQPQFGDAAGIDLVGVDIDAAHDYVVEMTRVKGLAHEERAPGLDGEVDRGERAGAVLRLDEGRARSIDDIDGAATIGGCVAGHVRRPCGCGSRARR